MSHRHYSHLLFKLIHRNYGLFYTLISIFLCRNCKVAGAEKFGLFVEFLPGRQGLLHVSELAPGEDLGDFDLDDKVDVTCVAVSLLSFFHTFLPYLLL